MINIIITSDYEIHGNGEGDPYKIMVEPTYRMIDLLNNYGAKLTIFADVAEISMFKDYKETHDEDLFYYDEIIDQLKYAISRNNDVQLHVHPSYYNSKYIDGRWIQNYSEYDLTQLKNERLNYIISSGKKFLELILREVNHGYQCNIFRAANWSMMPSENIIKALIKNDFKIDSSVFKYGKRNSLVKFDYSDAYHDMLPWPVLEDNICRFDKESDLFEVPIYAEKKHIWKFITINRIYRVLMSRLHPLENINEESSIQNKIIGNNFLKNVLREHSWKMDFNQCTGLQLIQGLKNAEKKYKDIPYDKPFVLIGHSKLFNKFNEKSLKPFLEFVMSNKDRFTFGLYKDIDLQRFKNI